eukprot:364837-Chlamydomonas_euryale.AAC.14
MCTSSSPATRREAIAVASSHSANRGDIGAAAAARRRAAMRAKPKIAALWKLAHRNVAATEEGRGSSYDTAAAAHWPRRWPQAPRRRAASAR